MRRTALPAPRAQVLETWVGEEAKDPLCLVDSPPRKRWREKPVIGSNPFPQDKKCYQNHLTEAAHPLQALRVTSQGTCAQQVQDPTGSWHNWESSDYPKHDESVDPGSEGLANHTDIFPFIIPNRNMTTLFINSPDTLPFPLLHTYTCRSLAVCYMTNCSTAFLPSSRGNFSEMLSAFKYN